MTPYERRLIDAIAQLNLFNARVLELILADGLTKVAQRALRYDNAKLQLRLEGLMGVLHTENEE